jgi:hypothetical protein
VKEIYYVVQHKAAAKTLTAKQFEANSMKISEGCTGLLKGKAPPIMGKAL